jgi:hypothetical protein
MRPTIDKQLNESEMGFRKNRSCTGDIFTIRQSVERTREYKEKLYLTFIDQEKAFY